MKRLLRGWDWPLQAVGGMFLLLSLSMTRVVFGQELVNVLALVNVLTFAILGLVAFVIGRLISQVDRDEDYWGGSIRLPHRRVRVGLLRWVKLVEDSDEEPPENHASAA